MNEYNVEFQDFTLCGGIASYGDVVHAPSPEEAEAVALVRYPSAWAIQLTEVLS